MLTNLVFMLLSVAATKRGTSQVGNGRHVLKRGEKKCDTEMKRNEALQGRNKC